MLVVLLNVKGERGGLTPDVKKAASEKGSNMFSVPASERRRNQELTLLQRRLRRLVCQVEKYPSVELMQGSRL